MPLDPELPSARLAFMIGDTGMPVVLTEELSASAVPAVDGVTVLSLDAEWPAISGRDGTDLGNCGAEPGCVAYVIYTSGSTGQPKGVVVEHRQAVNFLHGAIGRWQLSPSDVVLQYASLSFDVSVLDMFAPLLAGARTVLVPPGARRSPPRLAELIEAAGVTLMCLTPSVLSVLPVREFPRLRVLMTAGEELPSEVARRWVRPGVRLVNAYGPTEAVVLAASQELEGAGIRRRSAARCLTTGRTCLTGSATRFRWERAANCMSVARAWPGDT